MADDCWGGGDMYVNPYCPVCEYNVVGYMWLIHVRDKHDGVSPRSPYERYKEDA